MNKTDDIFNKIYSLTQEGKVKWETDNHEKSSFVATVGPYSIKISFNTMLYIFQVNDSNGNEITKVHKATMARSGNSNLPLEKLYEIARIKKMNESLDDLLSSLNSL